MQQQFHVSTCLEQLFHQMIHCVDPKAVFPVFVDWGQVLFLLAMSNLWFWKYKLKCNVTYSRSMIFILCSFICDVALAKSCGPTWVTTPIKSEGKKSLVIYSNKSCREKLNMVFISNSYLWVTSLVHPLMIASEKGRTWSQTFGYFVLLS
jgi:hypothetical protein